MVFAVNKPQAAKKSPLAGWLNKKQDKGGKGELPEMDVAGGLDRALRSSNTIADQPRPDHDEPVRNALAAIETVLYAIDRVRDILEQGCEIALSAKNIEEVSGRAMLAESYDELRLSIDASLEKIDPRAVVLIGKNQRHLDVLLGGKTRYSVSPMRLDVSDKGLNLSPPRDAFETYEEIDDILDQLDKALSRCDRAAASYCRDAQYLIARMNAAEKE